MKKLISLCLLAITILFSACMKDGVMPSGNISLFGYGGYNPPSYPHYQFFGPALSFIQLPLNHYFIYKDAATGSMDSVVVTESVLGSKFEPATTTTPGYGYDTYTLTLTTLSGGSHQTWYTGNAVANSNSDFSLATGPSTPPGFLVSLYVFGVIAA